MKPGSDETSGFKVVSKLTRSIPNATSRVAWIQTQMKPVVSKLTPSILNATSWGGMKPETFATELVAFGIGRVNFLKPLVSCNCNQAGCIWNWTSQFLLDTASCVTVLGPPDTVFWLMGGPWFFPSYFLYNFQRIKNRRNSRRRHQKTRGQSKKTKRKVWGIIQLPMRHVMLKSYSY